MSTPPGEAGSGSASLSDEGGAKQLRTPSIQDRLIALRFLADDDRKNPDAVAAATSQLICEFSNLQKDLDRLLTLLHQAKEGLDTRNDRGRQAALHALDAVLRFLMLFEQTHNEDLLTPLALLFGELISLDGGRVGPMLTPVKKPGGAFASAFYNTLKGITVFTARRLEASGLTPAESREAVARELAKAGVRPMRRGSRESNGGLTKRTIRKWQEDIDADIGLTTIAAREFRRCEADNVRRVLQAAGLIQLPGDSSVDEVELQQVTPGEFRRTYLKKLTRYVIETRLAPRKST